MEGEEKVRERNGEEEEEGTEEDELLGLKLKRSILVGKRGGPCTPPPTWNSISSHSQTLNTATARQLGANLWEILPHLNSISNMSHTAAPSSSLSRRHGNHHKNKGLQIQPVLEEDDAAEGTSSSSHLPDQPGSTGSFHREIAESLRRHHKSVNKNGRAIQPVSPASFGSSMELTQYNPGDTPSSSLELKGKVKTSTELLKVLNRIWTLEEQHASNSSLVRALKTELDNSRLRIKELLKEKQTDRKVIDDLMKQLVEGKFGRKNTEQERMKMAIHSLRSELEDERKMRKRSETLHHKLARELSDVKSSCNKSANEVERERRARILLEELCDEFALGIRHYEQEKRSAPYKTEKDVSLVLHMSEAWLDERVQMRLSDEYEKEMVAEKLSSEIEAFLRAQEKGIVRQKSNVRRSSLESYRLNEATSAPKVVDEDDDDSESNCFELSKGVGDFDIALKNPGVSRLQSRFEEHMMSQSASKRFGRLARNNSSSVEGERVHPEDVLVEVGPASPVKKWESKIEFEESTLKARLLEARSEGRQWHPHSNSRATKG